MLRILSFDRAPRFMYADSVEFTSSAMAVDRRTFVPEKPLRRRVHVNCFSFYHGIALRMSSMSSRWKDMKSLCGTNKKCGVSVESPDSLFVWGAGRVSRNTSRRRQTRLVQRLLCTERIPTKGRGEGLKRKGAAN